MTDDLRKQFVKDLCLDIEGVFPTLPSDVILFIACQFALESNYGSSNLAKVQKNYCGMKNPLVRPSTSVTRGDGQQHYACYMYRIHCIVDYFLCLSYHRPLAKELENLDLFKSFLKKFYCPEKDYIDKINSIYQQFKSLKDERKF